MWPATAWDDYDWDGNRARGWTVMGRMRDRQRSSVTARRLAMARIRENNNSMRMMTAAVMQQDYEDKLAAGWRGGWCVLVFLFAMPDEAAIQTLGRRGEYFDIRTGDTWDLFFPGYYESSNRVLESGVESMPLRVGPESQWYFSPPEFDALRIFVERATAGKWNYSGGADLVLLNAWVPDQGGPTVDWASVQSGSLSPDGERSLQAVIEKITRDLELGTEDATYGVGDLVQLPTKPPSDSTAKKIAISALGGVLATLGKSWLGL